jgi:serine/threonine protein kinase
MSSDSGEEIEELFFKGLEASEPERERLLRDVPDPQIVAAIRRLWDDAAAAPADFLRDEPPSKPGRAHKAGDLVDGRFELARMIGAGGMGEVYRAVDTRLGRSVAIKFLNANLAKHPATKALLAREARAVCRLPSHPNVCTVHDLSWDGETPFLVMELLTGETLAARLARGPASVTDAVAIGVSIVDGLAWAHTHNVIHRDLKPGNVMLTPFGPKLFDFGIARHTERTTSDDTGTLAPSGSFIGSASYASPEQAEGLAVDQRSDIFSIGCVLYEMVAGVKAFDGATPLSILAAVLRAEPRPIRDITPSIPLSYTRIVDKCLQKDPSRRFQYSTDLRHALDRLARSRFAADTPEDTLGADPEPPDASARGRKSQSTTTPTRDVDIDDHEVPAPGAQSLAERLAAGVLARGSTHPVCLMLSVVYGLMVGLALVVEVVYEWPTFRAWVSSAAAITGLSSVIVSLAALAFLRHRVTTGRPQALLLTVGIFVGWSIALALAIAPRLPDRPLVRATFQTMTANVGYPKSLLEALALPVLAVVPLHVVCLLEADLRRGRARRVYGILTSGPQGFSVPSTVVVSPYAASIVFGAVTVWWINANARLVEHLEIGPYHGVFLQLGVARAASGLLMLFAVLAWYIWTLNDLRRHAHLHLRTTPTVEP